MNDFDIQTSNDLTCIRANEPEDVALHNKQIIPYHLTEPASNGVSVPSWCQDEFELNQNILLTSAELSEIQPEMASERQAIGTLTPGLPSGVATKDVAPFSSFSLQIPPQDGPRVCNGIKKPATRTRNPCIRCIDMHERVSNVDSFPFAQSVLLTHFVV
jgi:hypothetical protein